MRPHDNTSAHNIPTSNIIIRRKCNELRGIMARSTQVPNMITRSTIIYETVSPGAAGISIYIYYGSKYRVRVVQTHTVGFDGPFRSRSVTLLPDPTIQGKPDFRSRTLVRRRTHSELGYLPIYTQKYTVVHLEPIRSLLDPF